MMAESYADVEMLLRGVVDPTTIVPERFIEIIIGKPHIVDAVRRFALRQTSHWEAMLEEVMEKTIFPSSAEPQ